MRYLAVETRRDMRSITIASNVSGLESSGESFPAKHSVSPAGTRPAVRAGFMKLSSTAFRLMARRDAAGVRLLTRNGLDWSPCQPRPDLQSSWRRLVRGIGATSMPNVLSDLPCCHPNSTAKKISGNSCGRTGCRTEFSNPSTTSSITAATPGTRSSISRGKSCPSPAAIGQPQVAQSEDWYNRPWGLPPGRFRLATNPASTGSTATAKTPCAPRAPVEKSFRPPARA